MPEQGIFSSLHSPGCVTGTPQAMQVITTHKSYSF